MGLQNLNNEYLENLPVLISFPRSGSHWLNCLIQFYFNRPKLRNKKPIVDGDDYLYFHDHDENSDLFIPHEKILYLYRNPVDIIFSRMQAEGDLDIDQYAEKIKNHYRKYLLNENYTKIKYERLKNNLPNEFKIIIKFFGYKDLNKEKLTIADKKSQLYNIIQMVGENKYLNKNLGSKQYEEKRKHFKRDYGEQIDNKIITEDLEEYF